MVDFLLLLGGLLVGIWGTAKVIGVISARRDQDNVIALANGINEIALRAETHVRRASVTAGRSNAVLVHLAEVINLARCGSEVDASLIEAVWNTTEHIAEFHEIINSMRSDTVDLLRIVGVKVRVENGETQSPDA